MIFPFRSLEAYANISKNKYINYSQPIKNCIKYKKKKTCIKAIAYLERLQLEEADINNLACQSRILALQSSLIAYMYRISKKENSIKYLNEAKSYCYSLKNW